MSFSSYDISRAIQALTGHNFGSYREPVWLLVEAVQVQAEELSRFQEDVDEGVLGLIDRLERCVFDEKKLREEGHQYSLRMYDENREMERRTKTVEARLSYLEKKLAEVTTERDDYSRWYREAKGE